MYNKGSIYSKELKYLHYIKLVVKVQNKRHVRAIVVTEHANLSSLLINDSSDISDTIIVMVRTFQPFPACY